MSGDILDARIAIALQEHWLNVLRGIETWNRPLLFYPTKDTLGYNDGYFLFGLAFSAFRWMGIDIYAANELAGACFRVLGFYGTLGLGRRVLRLPFPLALLAAAVVTISSAAYLQSAHIQLLTVGLAPCLAWLVVSAVSAMQQGKTLRPLLQFCAAALLFDAWLLTAFYTAWFTVFFTILAAIAAMLQKPGTIAALPSRLRPAVLLPALCVFLAGLVPFLSVYLPKAHETGMHPIQTVIGLTPEPLDYLNTGSGNLLFGWLDRLVWSVFRQGPEQFNEHTIGLPPILICLAIAGAVLSFTATPRAKTVWWRSLAVALLVALVLTVHIDGASLWRWVYLLVPGARAVRVVTRFALLLQIVAALLACYALTFVPGRYRLLLPLLAVLLLAEEVTTDGLYQLDRTAELRLLHSIPHPPAFCKTFYVTKARAIDEQDAIAKYELPLSVNVDGMLIAELMHLPTLNGHASFLPAGFGFSYATASQYDHSAPDSITNANLQAGLCGLDLQTGTWDPFVVAHSYAAAVLGQEISFKNGAGEAYLRGGWSGPENEGRWTDGPTATMAMQVDAGQHDIEFALTARAFGGSGAPGAVDVIADSQQIARWHPSSVFSTLRATIPHRLLIQHDLRIQLRIEQPLSPKEAGISEDRRMLGLFVAAMRLSDATGPK